MPSFLCVLAGHPGCLTLVVTAFIALITAAPSWQCAKRPVRGVAGTHELLRTDAVRVAAEGVAGVRAVEGLRVWTLPSGVQGVTGRVELDTGAAWEDVLTRVHSAARAELEARPPEPTPPRV